MAHPWDDNWDVGNRLGKGGQGLTHLATRKTDPSAQAALKTLKNNKDPQARGRMHREVASLEVLSSAGGSVPRVFDHNTEHYKDTSVELFVAMEYIPGPTLRELVERDGPLGIATATAVTRRICETIDLAHSFPILHRDLKPENVIARSLTDADIVIVDYGLSFNAEDPDVTVTDDTFRNRFLDLPETNTPGGNRRDPRSDVTAACALYYYLLTGHVPGQLQGGDGRLPHMRPGFSLQETVKEKSLIGQLEVLFNRGFAPNVDNRFQTVAEFQGRIALMTADTSGAPPEDPIAVAERASAVLRQRDRKTQLQEFQPHANTIQQALQKFANGFAKKLGRFKLSAGNEGSLGAKLPENLDRVSPHQFKVQINPAHHNHLRIVVYTVASRGEQCVILRQRYSRNGSNNQIEPVDEYEELLWYDATNVPDLAPITTDIQHWINAAIQELTDVVITQ
ncbi:MAG TPA: protein kinase [Pirellulaceae bacterium]|nr:protein kinase [Pirellulaceae bacterium]HMP71466.1 protein kinase [Pirellulaceae bacterium]